MHVVRLGGWRWFFTAWRLSCHRKIQFNGPRFFKLQTETLLGSANYSHIGRWELRIALHILAPSPVESLEPDAWRML